MLKIWTCYHYSKHEAVVLVTETEEHLRKQVRAIITAEWEEEDGPMPEDFDELVQAYSDNWGDRYFGDWGCKFINPALCEEVDA